MGRFAETASWGGGIQLVTKPAMVAPADGRESTDQRASQSARQPSSQPARQPATHSVRQPDSGPAIQQLTSQPENSPAIPPASLPTSQPINRPTSQPAVVIPYFKIPAIRKPMHENAFSLLGGVVPRHLWRGELTLGGGNSTSTAERRFVNGLARWSIGFLVFWLAGQLAA